MLAIRPTAPLQLSLSLGPGPRHGKTTKSTSPHLAPPLPHTDLAYTHTCAYTCRNACSIHMQAYTIHAHLCTRAWSDSTCVSHVDPAPLPTWQSKRIFSGFRSLQKIRENSLVESQPLSERVGDPGPGGRTIHGSPQRCRGTVREYGHWALGRRTPQPYPSCWVLLRQRTKFTRMSWNTTLSCWSKKSLGVVLNRGRPHL
jgi:hypothetical protein